ncbi:hypothetical protein YTPLAS73_04160 [Nitrosarchaeum sp.]|nr:hypothetical protein YTPLAS73_04160 [Nitrosarchaeum sp.]
MISIKNQSEDMIKDNDIVVCADITLKLTKYSVLVVTRCIEERSDTTNCFLIPCKEYYVSCQKDW